MHITLPQPVKTIIQTLEAAGFEAFAVGGCVRDSLLHRTPEDWDITTSALPEEVKQLFRRTIDTGIQHGTVTIMIGKEGYEVTTYRIDGAYEDSRHPMDVTFTRSLTEDLRRRDFTINAMAYNDSKGLVDVFDGISDLEKGCIRAVGNPKERFGEDALRILRALRFSAQLGYEIATDTKAAIGELAPTLEKISAERIRTELVKLLVSPHPELLREAYELGVTKVFLPEFDVMMQTVQNNPHHDSTVGEHTLRSVCAIAPDRNLRLSMLLHDVGKPVCRTEDEQHIHHFHGHCDVGSNQTREILRRLKFDNETIRIVCSIVKYHDFNPVLKPSAVRKAINKTGEDIFPMLFAVKRADIMAQSDYQREEKLQYIDELQRIYEEITEAKDCVSIKNLAVTGKEVIHAGMKPGKGIGQVLERLLEDVIETPEHNTAAYLMARLPELIAEIQRENEHICFFHSYTR